MNFAFTPEEESFRQEVDAFLDKEWLPLDIHTSAIGVLTKEQWDKSAAFRRKLGEKRWLGAAWPEEYGGLGKSMMHQMILHEEMAYYGATVDFNVYVLSPALLMAGSPELKRRFMPPSIRQEIVWCQGFSEPNAGSDLAGMQMSARDDGDDFVVSGSKIWTSQGHFADYIHFLARTDPTADPPHRGISYLIAEMKSPGITVAPLYDASASHHFNQVYFDNVRVPKSQLIGEKNGGWRLAMAALENERGTNMLYMATARRMLDHLLAYVRSKPAIELRLTPSIRQRLAEAAIDCQVSRRLNHRVAGLAVQGKPFNPQASIAKCFAGELQKRVAKVNAEVLGLHAQLWLDDAAPLGSEISDDLLGSLSQTIAGGSSEIQRDIIAARGLGLPRYRAPASNAVRPP